MTRIKAGLLAVAVLGAFGGSARAQFVSGGFRGAGQAGYPGYGVTSGYYTTTSGFGNYGFPGSYPNYSGYGFSGYGPAANLGGYFAPIRPNLAPQTGNNMGGLMNTIRTQTGRGNSYQYGSNVGIGRRRGR